MFRDSWKPSPVGTIPQNKDFSQCGYGLHFKQAGDIAAGLFSGCFSAPLYYRGDCFVIKTLYEAQSLGEQTQAEPFFGDHLFSEDKSGSKHRTK
jgi:hypothetical protein